MNTQREVIYAQRQKVLDGEDLQEQHRCRCSRSIVESDVSTALSGHGGVVNEDGLKGLANVMEGIYFAKGTLASRREQLLDMNADELTDTVFEHCQAHLRGQGSRLHRPRSCGSWSVWSCSGWWTNTGWTTSTPWTI